MINSRTGGPIMEFLIDIKMLEISAIYDSHQEMKMYCTNEWIEKLIIFKIFGYLKKVNFLGNFIAIRTWNSSLVPIIAIDMTSEAFYKEHWIKCNQIRGWPPIQVNSWIPKVSIVDRALYWPKYTSKVNSRVN